MKYLCSRRSFLGVLQRVGPHESDSAARSEALSADEKESTQFCFHRILQVEISLLVPPTPIRSDYSDVRLDPDGLPIGLRDRLRRFANGNFGTATPAHSFTAARGQNITADATGYADVRSARMSSGNPSNPGFHGRSTASFRSWRRLRQTRRQSRHRALSPAVVRTPEWLASCGPCCGISQTVSPVWMSIARRYFKPGSPGLR